MHSTTVINMQCDRLVYENMQIQDYSISISFIRVARSYESNFQESLLMHSTITDLILYIEPPQDIELILGDLL